MESIVRRVREEEDKKIYECIANYGIDVNKEELEKALRYDRDQYVKGYKDGKAEAMQWIPCSERLPEELVPVNVTWVNRKPASYYEEIKDKPFTATAVYAKGLWFWWSSVIEDNIAEYGIKCGVTLREMIHKDIEITAWMPLPPAFEGE